MQNKKGFIDEQAFEKQAWQEMSKLLDQEIPVNRKKRIVPLFFWGVGIAAIFLTVLYVNILEQKQPVIQVDEKVETPLETTEAIASLVDFNSEKIKDKFDNDLDIKEDPIQDNISAVSADKTNDDNQNFNFLNDLNLQKGSNISNQEVTDLTSVEIDRTQGNTNQSKIIEKEVNIPVVALKRKLVSDISAIQKLDIQEFETINSRKLPLISISSTTKKLSNFSLRIGYGSNLINQSNYHVGLDWQIGVSEKWSFVTGLQYHFFPQTNLSSSDRLFAQSEDSIVHNGNNNNLPDLGGAFNPNFEEDDMTSEFNSISPSDYFKKRHAIVLPLNIQYQMKKKWSVSTGLRVAYLFQKQKFESNPLVFDSSIPNIDFNNTIEYWSNLGIQFNPIPKWGISLHYNRSWTPMSKAYSDNVSVLRVGKNNFNHFWETSVSYRF